ncbi:LacI family transcriptional regulator [Verrucomicrobia bacterium LW23]|nr:LacI family transcriptional regulator [Verrucomicrobia bacterium LW23]
MMDIARAVGVSKNTVSLALRNDPQIPQARREEIGEAAKRLGYTKNAVVGQLMAQLRGGKTATARSGLALVNANEDPDAFRRHPTIPTYVEGCRRQAAAQGYTLDEDFWLHDPAMNGARLCQIFNARNIRGAVIVGLMRTDQLPARFRLLWGTYPCVVTGSRTSDPALSFACADHHSLALQACQRAIHRGYRRPALVLDRTIDELVEHRFSAGMAIAQRDLPPDCRVPGFYESGESRAMPPGFVEWLERERPDAILSLYHSVRTWLKEIGLEVPRDIALIQLERRADHPDWSGMDQHNDIVGEAAVEMLIGMILKGEYGIPRFPRATLIGGSWVPGSTTGLPLNAAGWQLQEREARVEQRLKFALQQLARQTLGK